MACDYKIRRLLEWSDAQEGFYYLLSPPVVLLMYTTENRDGAEQESQSIERAFPEFNIPITKVENPTKQDMTSAILKSVEGRDDVSALIVIIMSHGAQGVVCAADGDVSIQDILLQMQGAVAQPEDQRFAHKLSSCMSFLTTIKQSKDCLKSIALIP